LGDKLVLEKDQAADAVILAAADAREAAVAAAIDAEMAALVAAAARAAAPYDATRELLTEAVMKDLVDPASDGSSPGSVTGWMSKKGKGITPAFQRRWIVLKRGWMLYFNSPEARETVRPSGLWSSADFSFFLPLPLSLGTT